MANFVKKEWEKYSINAHGNSRSFSSVSHTAHIKDAIRIIEDGVIRSSLIWDESCLNNSRTCVSWVSPNRWAHGSIYGNVSFEFDWNTIVEDRKLYWVEAIETYSPPAYRILITDKNYDSWDLLNLYDMTSYDGPICRDGEEWWRCGDYTGEFLIDGDLPLTLCKGIEFVGHHKSICRNGSSCKEFGLSQYDAGPIIIANLVGRNVTAICQGSCRKNTIIFS